MAMRRQPPRVIRRGSFSLGQVQEDMGCSPSFLRAEVDSGRLKVGDNGLVTLQDLTAWYRDQADRLDAKP